MKAKYLFFATCFGYIFTAGAATIDLADKPLASGTSGEVKPNVMLVLDDSGSMGWTHMPDHVRSLRSKVGYKAAQCNGIYFNPAVTYTPPVKADGTPYPDIDFFNAPYNGFNPTSTKVDLSSKFKSYDDTTSWNGGDDTEQAAYYYTYSGSQPAMSYTYNSSGDVGTSTTFYRECNGEINTGNFTKVTVDSSRRTNFANWYSYYRIRLYTAKTALGTALKTLIEPQNYRIGYSTHSYTGTDTSNDEFQNIADYCAGDPGCTQRTTLYDKVYQASADGGTPLRAALSKVGRIFAGQTGTDPVQYSCQQNFTILTTDGFWNGSAGYRLDGSTAIGNQDGSASKPLWDGLISNTVETYRRYNYTNTTSGCSGSRRSVFKQEQRQTVTTPIEPAGPATTSSWSNYGSPASVVTCSTSWASFIPSPNPSVAESISTTSTETGGTSNTLADVAMHYYQTDLRTSALGNCTGAVVNSTTYDVCENNVPGAGSDTASHQHMTTFTLGLGVNGTLKYCENYDSGGCPDFEAIKQGTKTWPDPMPTENLTRVDDLWHAAVDGRGKYFSANTPQAMASGLQKALAGVSVRTASAAAAATSNLEPVAGDNYAYVAMYTTVDWDGNIEAREIDISNGQVLETAIWSAQTQLDGQVSTSSDTRAIYFASGGTLKTFNATNLSAYVTTKNFSPGTDNPGGGVSQWTTMTSTEQTQATQTSVINYIRGQTQHEDQGGNTYRLYRDRKHALGDIVNAAPVYVKKPPFKYVDNNYSTFAANKATRQSVVYAGGNDGMLHAFNGDTGAEMWAFVPTAVIPNLYKLADKNYSVNHRFYVDGPIVAGDICPSPPCNANQWKTILVGGLGKGGKAYYALDITDPANPVLLWEFAETDLGYTYGNPIITKMGNQWVVLVASGYDNSTGDGKGRLFVLRASDGAKLKEIISDDTLTDPAKSGIAKISNWVDSTMTDNSTQHVYGGDLDGNVYRFDITTTLGTVVKLATLGKVGGAPTQPITTKPELAEVKIGGALKRVVLIGTGKYFGTSDIATTDLMTLYAIKDDLVSPPYGNFRTHSKVKEQGFSGSDGIRSISYTAMADDSIGWYMDLDAELGERVNVDPKYQLGWWAVPGNIPDPNVCNVGGKSWLYFINPWPNATKLASSTEMAQIGNALIVGINTIKLPNGKAVTIVTTSDAKYPNISNPPIPIGSKVRRVSWRELTR
jgi:type IV pilus assembly protein PilY1